MRCGVPRRPISAITHIKPGEMEAVMAEIGRLGTPHRIHALAAGDVMKLG